LNHRSGFLLGCSVVLLCVSARPSSAREPTVTRLLIGANYGAPLGLSGTVGFVHGRPALGDGESEDLIGGVLMRASAGQGGLKGSVGYGLAAVVGPVMAGGGSLNATVIHTWGSPVDVDAGGTYVGGELELTFFARTTIGYAARVGGRGAKDSMLTWSVGVGF
jgi:hypothetical protein